MDEKYYPCDIDDSCLHLSGRVEVCHPVFRVSSLSLRCFAGLARPRAVADLCQIPYMLCEPIMLQHSSKELVSYIANSLHTLIDNLHTDQWMNG